MIVNKRSIKISVTDILLLICCVLYCTGIKNWFPVCSMSGDKIMNCHWAGEVLFALSLVLSGLSLVHIFIPDEKIKAGMDISSACFAVFAMLIPGNLIALCKNTEMPCRNGTSVWTTVFMLSIIIIAAVDLFVYMQSLSSGRHKRRVSGESE